MISQGMEATESYVCMYVLNLMQAHLSSDSI